ncbi:MAG: hypothetical protein K6T75_04050 [Acetobacteraceae bacterium]|nr:hypothetical protein [Acetobacteraceae bacterium]
MTSPDLGSLLGRLDPRSARMVWHLACEGHAPLDTLARSCGLTHAQALDRIRSVINPLGRDLFGQDLFTFSVCRVDPQSGRKVTFNWWLQLPGGVLVPPGRALADAFPDEGGLLILAAVGWPLQPNGHAEVSCRNGVLQVLVRGEGGRNCPSP